MNKNNKIIKYRTARMRGKRQRKYQKKLKKDGMKEGRKEVTKQGEQRKCIQEQPKMRTI